MATGAASQDLTLEPLDNERLAMLCGQFDEHLRLIERRLGVEINNRSNAFRVIGEAGTVQSATEVLRRLYGRAANEAITLEQVHLALVESGADAEVGTDGAAGAPDGGEPVIVNTLRGPVRGRGRSQQRYLAAIRDHDLVFGIGPAGTGKTYLAVAAAVDALERDLVRRLVLVRPAVEAGEKLGFLPGDLAQKVDPYLRPMYDALYEMLGFERVARLMDKHIIEVAPLAFMRGRTLNESFVILDEAQNTTSEQMKMFLTRIGFGSKAVVTGDVTQVDLPRQIKSGLREVVEVLGGVEGVAFSFFSSRDVVRHPLVQRVVQAYERQGKPGGSA
jgi:phosphate starvation-inducible protein PhoH and related proteins